MATSLEFVQFVCEQIAEAGRVRYLRMFGEFVVYCDEKPVFLVCDDTVFAKKLPEVSEFFESRNVPLAYGFPFVGAKEHIVVDVEDTGFATELAGLLAGILPLPKRKKRKLKRG